MVSNSTGLPDCVAAVYVIECVGLARTWDTFFFLGDMADSFTGNSHATVRGEDGSDVLRGSGEVDTLDGGPGDDRVEGGAGADRLFGGEGNDLIVASDGEADAVDCGDGIDTAYVDAIDVVDANCEVVGPPPPSDGSRPRVRVRVSVG
jgi:Ca2+-binding RTX toxin-like protein